HATVHFVSAALIEHHLSWRFISARKERTDHDRRSSSRQGLHDISRVFDTTVSDKRDSCFVTYRAAVEDRLHLRDTDPCDHAGGTNGTRPNANFDSIDT